MAIPGALEALDAVDEPAGAGFHETEANFGILVEDAVKQNAGEVDHLAEGMAERVDRRVRRHVVQAHVIVHAAVDADAAFKSIGFLIDRPVFFVAEMILRADHAGARQHGAAESQLFDDPAQLFHRFRRLLQRDQSQRLKAVSSC